MVIHVGLPHVGCRFESGNSYKSNQIKNEKTERPHNHRGIIAVLF